ncbi:MAG: hypothetical protein LBG94_09815 [Treponema sp.]|jgi:hypothetical protein|nr:hypothetical protein [Treponema sp.]
MTKLEYTFKTDLPIMEQAINAYYNITAESEFRERERLWSKARHDEAQALSNAEEIGEKRIIELLESGKSPEEIIKEYKAKTK